MSCIVEFTESLLQFEFNTEGYRQKILVDMLLGHCGMDFQEIATAINIKKSKVYRIYQCKQFLTGEEANDLGQLFLINFGRIFFRKFLIVRNFT